MQTTPATELEAVNTLLNVIGESPINSLESSGNVDAATARSILSEVNRSLQAKGWHWNTETMELPLSSPDRFILLPSNTMRCSVPGQGVDVVQRGGRLYDRRRNTYAFERPLRAELVLLLGFDELPQAARELCVARAARVFQQRVLGSVELYQFTARDEAASLADLMNAEAESLDLNILTNSAVSRVLRR